MIIYTPDYVCCQYNLLPAAPAEGLNPNLPLQEAHLTPTAPREGGQSPDPALASRDQNQGLPEEGQGLNPLPGKWRGLAVLGTAAIVNVGPGHNFLSHNFLSHAGEAPSIYIAGLEILCSY